ncbi:hypothetical protein Ais01nite_03150 [Asanoa ishikariensis]|uniref:SnoaL-like domain-containing protein n=1 Tax=Asanoa ishikariensis TaxID=137265 RepID=A0A1H3TLL3_9ACTN|nr:hypothetical protein [Asanoa ishikariensis]GIF62280.1 hypothetical protein Ais01nite_03150 [Asanoa ishikariensis]SDZ50545.1 hypothetical protein SAMN05421684_5916 [Asanoa ishikariensis]
MSSRVDTTIASWRAAGESRDAELAATCLAQEVQVISPLTARFRFQGRAQASEMLSAAFEVIDTIRFHTELGDESARALFYYGRCRKEEFEEAQLLRFNADGLIEELTLFGRPLPGVTAVMAAIGPVMLRRRQQPILARMIQAATAPLALLTRTGEKRLVPLADPNRPAPKGNPGSAS